MNSSEILNLNASPVAKRPATKHFSNVHSTLVFLPVESSIYVNADRISRISITPPSFTPFFSILPTILSSTQVIVIWCRLAVNISLLVTLRKLSRRPSCKALRWDKVMTIRRVCIVQYRIVFSFHIFGQGPIVYYVPEGGGSCQKSVVYQNVSPRNNYI